MTSIPEREAKVHMNMFRRPPMTLVKGQGARVEDSEGKTYVDCVAGIAVDALGHGHPGLAEVIAEQARSLIHVSNLYYTEPQINLAEMLVNASGLDKIFFVNSGAEANEGAIKLARKWGIQNRDGAYTILSTENSFHGRTMTTVAATGTPAYREPFGPPTPGFDFVAYNDFEALEEKVDAQTAAILLEPIQGEGGVNVPDDSYLQKVRELCDRENILLILDEVQTGCGRTGKMFAFEHYGIKPDIMTLAKGLGGGVPIGAVLANEKAAVFQPGDHGSTFGGNVLACAASAFVVDQILNQGVLETANARSEYMDKKIAELEDRSDLVIGQRGKGLLRAIILRDDIAADVVGKGISQGLLSNPVRPNAIRLMPPLTVTEEELDDAFGIIETVLQEFE
ncbi:MAG: acetylornithine transaminase [Chloroflexota bacterium]|jgi:acetylornithine/N-succinyldiaminopimelate aminotransferase|nr:aspartate aminotransferase family protein [Chloroflexota bacterium]MEC7788185.1 acetylornithine transaminase [Chloroflexota bacterium]